jgi:hypothetical protein
MDLFLYKIKYLKYKTFSRHKKGHGIHSPFLYRFIMQVLRNEKESIAFEGEENLLKTLMKDKQIMVTTENRIFRRNLKTKKKGPDNKIQLLSVSFKYRKFLYNLSSFSDPSNIIELGTSDAISAFYLSMVREERNTYILEETDFIQKMEEDNKKYRPVSDIHFLKGPPASQLELLLQNLGGDFLAIIHMHPEYRTSLEYFELLLNKITTGSVVVLDGIHRSCEIEKGWNYIQHHDCVHLTIDLFFIGIVFFRKELLKENYVIKY